MEELKKSDKAVMNNWRKYLGINGNAAEKDIFGIIEKAIMVAASHYPVEFQIQREKIAKTLFSLNSCDDHVEEENNIGCKEGMKKMSDDPNVNVLNNNNHHHHHWDAINHEETEMVTVTDEVLRIKQILDTYESESVVDVYELLSKLEDMGLSYKNLEATKIGTSVSRFQNQGSRDVRLMARSLIKMWRAVADQWFEKQQKEKKEKEESIIKGAAAEKKQMVLKKESSTTTKSRSNVVKIKIINRINSEKKAAKMEDKSTTTTTINNNSNIEKKLEATKRKLHQRYQEVENAKRQRKIQVVELHQLPKAINQNRKSLKMW